VTGSAGAPRRARPADLDRLAELWLEITHHHAALDPLFTLRQGAGPEVRRLLAAQIAGSDTEILVWDSPPDGLLGFCTVCIDQAPPILQETRRAEITDLGVDGASRRRGIGRALAAAAMAWAGSRGVARVEVRVAAANREAQAFWRGLGFDDLMDVLQRRL
jgi:ribosomal protein S18 acetylase RimI-like enzyme